MQNHRANLKKPVGEQVPENRQKANAGRRGKEGKKPKQNDRDMEKAPQSEGKKTKPVRGACHLGEQKCLRGQKFTNRPAEDHQASSVRPVYKS